MWDAQEGVPGSGDYPLQINTAYAIELNTKVYIEAWKKDIRVMLEEPGFWGGCSRPFTVDKQNLSWWVTRKITLAKYLNTYIEQITKAL